MHCKKFFLVMLYLFRFTLPCIHYDSVKIDFGYVKVY